MGKTILYYPTIRIEDGQWLRNAILYWDNIASIVPGFCFDEFNSPEVECLRDAGVYRALYPISLEADDELCNRFCKEVKEKIIEHTRENRRGATNDSRIHIDKLTVGQNRMLHINKTPDSILDFFREEGLVSDNCDGPWLNMNSTAAEIYMSVLAKYLAKYEGDTDIGTDVDEKFYYPYKELNYKNEKRKDFYIDMALQDILPTPNMDGITIEQLIDFRKAHTRELNHFRRRIEFFQSELKNSHKDIYDFRDKVISLRNAIDSDLKEVDGLLREESIPFRRMSLKSLIPIALGSSIELASLSGHLSQVGEIVANTILGVSLCSMPVRFSYDYNLTESNAYLFYARKDNLILSR